MKKDTLHKTLSNKNSLKRFANKAYPGVWIFLITLVAFGAYGNTLFNDFVFDDIQLIKDNDAIKDVRYISEIFSGNLWGLLGKTSNYYRPLAPLTYMLIYKLFGLSPWAFHLVNILFHIGTSLLVYLIISRLLKKNVDRSSEDLTSPAFIAAVAFTVHPIHTEAVAWAVGIMDLGCAFFCLLSFYFYLRSDDQRFSKGSSMLSLLAFFLATLYKEPALTFPFILIAYAYAFRKQASRSALEYMKMITPFFLLTSVYLLMRIYALRAFAPLQTHTTLSLNKWILNILVLFTGYLQKLIFPVNLNVMHILCPAASLFSLRGILSLIIFTFFIGAVCIAVKRNRFIFIGLIFILLPLLPALYTPFLSQKPENALAERYLYLPSFGFALITASFLVWVKIQMRQFSKIIFIFSAALAIFATMSVTRNTAWKNNYALWSDSVQKSPESASAHENLGYALLYSGQTRKGYSELYAALKLDPEIPDKIIANGIIYSNKGLLNKAILEFNTALLFAPDSVVAHYNLGLAYHNKGWITQAIDQYLIALRLRPDYADAYINLGIAYGETGSLDKAIENFQTAIRLNPQDAYAHHNLARAYTLKGLPSQAEEERNIASRLSNQRGEHHEK